MCGIFGIVAGGNNLREVELRYFAASLAKFTESRGKDAAGFAGWADGNILTDKAPITASELAKTSTAWRKLVFNSAYSLIGHTRQATSGSPKENKNNHPFHSDRYSLIHNGIISGHEIIAKRIGAKLATDCDSEILLHLAESGKNIRTSVEKLYTSVGNSGSFSVAMLDKRNGSLILFKSRSMPLYAGYVERWNAFVFASTMDIIERALYNTMLLPKENAIAQSVLKSFDEVESGTVVIVKKNLFETRFKVADAESDLYSDYGRLGRSWLYRLAMSGVTSKDVLAAAIDMKHKPRKESLSKEHKKTFNLFNTLSASAKISCWSGMNKEKFLNMNRGEQAAYLEFLNV